MPKAKTQDEAKPTEEEAESPPPERPPKTDPPRKKPSQEAPEEEPSPPPSKPRLKNSDAPSGKVPTPEAPTVPTFNTYLPGKGETFGGWGTRLFGSKQGRKKKSDEDE